jgi:hypothetical protein
MFSAQDNERQQVLEQILEFICAERDLSAKPIAATRASSRQRKWLRPPAHTAGYSRSCQRLILGRRPRPVAAPMRLRETQDGLATYARMRARPRRTYPVMVRPSPQSVRVAARSSRAGSGTTSRCGRDGSPPTLKRQSMDRHSWQYRSIQPSPSRRSRAAMLRAYEPDIFRWYSPYAASYSPGAKVSVPLRAGYSGRTANADFASSTIPPLRRL